PLPDRAVLWRNLTTRSLDTAGRENRSVTKVGVASSSLVSRSSAQARLRQQAHDLSSHTTTAATATAATAASWTSSSSRRALRSRGVIAGDRRGRRGGGVPSPPGP